jgi:glycosyltransferase involved in cell wall biosynthesis
MERIEASVDKLRFTVATPVLNGEKYIAETIESVISQSYSHWRYIIMDGGSTDKTLEIAKRYAKSDERITVVSGKDKGMYDAVFKGLESDDGDICCWINADDKFFPWSFSIVADAVNEGHDWVTGIQSFWDKKGRLFLLALPTAYPRKLIKAGYFNGRGLGWIQQEGTFFTRKLLSKLSNEQVEQIRSMKLAGDFLLWKSLAEHSPLKLLSTAIGGFRVHETNMSKLSMTKYYDEVKEVHGRTVPVIFKLIFRSLALIPAYIEFRKRLRKL